MTSITVDTKDLYAALRSVSVHASPDPDEVITHRVRLSVAQDLTITATNRYTAGMALVSIEEHGDGEVGHIDLAPLDVKEITSLFKPSKDAQDEMLRIAADGDHVTVTDCSGLFDGKQYRLPRRDSPEIFPDIPKLVAAILAQTAMTPERLEVNGILVGLFTAAAKAYGSTLTIEPTGDRTSLVIGCGESFIGLLMPVRTSEDRGIELNGWRRAWRHRLPEVNSERADQVVVSVRASLRDTPSQDLTGHDNPGDE